LSDGQLGGITVCPERTNTVSRRQVFTGFKSTSSAYRPALAFVVVDEAAEDVIIDSFPYEMMR
jgi:hypothetical protein